MDFSGCTSKTSAPAPKQTILPLKAKAFPAASSSSKSGGDLEEGRGKIETKKRPIELVEVEDSPPRTIPQKVLPVPYWKKPGFVKGAGKTL